MEDLHAEARAIAEETGTKPPGPETQTFRVSAVGRRAGQRRDHARRQTVSRQEQTLKLMTRTIEALINAPLIAIAISLAIGACTEQPPADAVRQKFRDAAAARQKAEQGDAEAQYRLAKLYFSGLGVPEDYNEAAKWMKSAAEQGHALAQFNLGEFYVNGWGVPGNHTEGLKWMKRAAEQGEVLAQLRLGYAYQHGYRAPQDYGEAVKWYMKAAEQGDRTAQMELQEIYKHWKGP